MVQLYIQDLTQSQDRPVKELKGFSKLELAPGETKEAYFKLDYRSFAWYDTETAGWFAAPGKYRICIGASSQRIYCQAEITLCCKAKSISAVDANTTFGQLLKNAQTAPMAKGLVEKIFGEPVQAETETAQQALTAEMRRQMIDNAPIRALRNFGGIRQAEFKAILDKLNTALLKQ